MLSKKMNSDLSGNGPYGSNKGPIHDYPYGWSESARSYEDYGSLPPQGRTTSGDVVSEGEESEYRIYVSSRGNAAVAWHVLGNEQLEVDIRLVAKLWPNDTIYVREVTESLVRIVKPGGVVVNIK